MTPKADQSKLTERHLAELRASGLDDETIRTAGAYSASGQSVTGVLGWQPKDAPWGEAILFPYLAEDGSDTGYVRVKPDFPRCNAEGRAIKYESPQRKQNQAYFPPGFAAAFMSAKVIVITEGEKKTLAAKQAGCCCIGLSGVWAFQQRRLRDDRGKVFGARKLIRDLASLDWQDRVVVITFDSDVDGRPDLQMAEYRLAELLKAKGADVRVARIPRLAEGKTGLDDFLVHHAERGPSELGKLIDSAQPPELPRVSGPMDLAKVLVEESLTGDTGLRLRYWREDFWRFNGRCYEPFPENEMHARVLRWLDNHGFDARPRTATDVLKCIEALSLVPFSREMPCWLDDEDHGDGWVSFENGLFKIGDPSAIQKLPHTARFFSPWTMEYAFDPRSDCPEWIAFLNDVLDSDPERIDLLQRWFGLFLISDTSFQKFLLLIGPPRAGKGTIVRVIAKLIGRANCASPTLSGLSTQFGLATITTKAVAIIPDAHIGKRADAIRVAEVLKSVVGEDPQDVDRKYREPISSVRLPTRFVITCNELAHFTDPSGALAARMSVIPFYNSYLGREDRSLERRLLAELPGIVNWAIVGLARLRAEGRLNVPSKSQSIHDNFKRLSSPTAAFMEDCVELHPTFSEATADVYAAWAGWCKAHGHTPGCDARLGERLRTVSPLIERVRPRLSDGTRPYHYKCLRLLPLGWEHAAEGRMILERGKAEAGDP